MQIDLSKKIWNKWFQGNYRCIKLQWFPISAVLSTDRRLHVLFFRDSFHGWPLGDWPRPLTFSCLVYKVTFPSAVTMGVHVVGIVAVIVFYILILGVGLWAARKSRGETDSENVMLAGRNIGILVGVFTMTGQCLCRSRTILCQRLLFGLLELHQAHACSSTI